MALVAQKVAADVLHIIIGYQKVPAWALSRTRTGAQVGRRAMVLKTPMRLMWQLHRARDQTRPWSLLATTVGRLSRLCGEGMSMVIISAMHAVS